MKPERLSACGTYITHASHVANILITQYLGGKFYYHTTSRKTRNRPCLVKSSCWVFIMK